MVQKKIMDFENDYFFKLNSVVTIIFKMKIMDTKIIENNKTMQEIQFLNERWKLITNNFKKQ